MDKKTVINKIKTAGNNARKGISFPYLATVSGVLSTKPHLIKYAAERLGFDLVTTKSFQILPNEGNREPILCEPNLGCFGNSVGLRNPGMQKALEELSLLRSSWKSSSLLNISLSASSPQDFITLIKNFELVADLIELNFSCPHAARGYGASIGSSCSISSSYIAEIKDALPNLKVPLFVKLTPNVDNIGEIAKAVIKEGADGITAINTVGPNLYTEPHSKAPILQNKLGGKGGMSGAWIFERAIECIKQIREAVGHDIPIIGMGGLSSGSTACAALKAGADVIGIGSACAMVEQDNLQAYFKAIREDTVSCINGNDKDTSSVYLRKNKALVYEPKTIIKKEIVSEDVIIIHLTGSCNFEAGQFVFLWIPNVGEKPFSLAESKNHISLIIKRRGSFTNALFNLKEGDTIYMRGIYGKGVITAESEAALLLAGGTGVALLPSLASKLKAQGVCVFAYTGTTESCEQFNSIDKIIAELGVYKKIYDNGIVGRVLLECENDINNKEFKALTPETLSSSSKFAAYIVGPMVFMKNACNMLCKNGVKDEQIYLSLEMNTMCGVGLCGECACGDILTCKKGTFVRLDYLKSRLAI